MAIITFDFDGTLNECFFKQTNPYKEKIQNLAKTFISEGHDVRIVTRRYENNFDSDEHTMVYETAEHLGIPRDKIHFTNREWKFKRLNELEADFHIDDDESDIFNIKMYCTKTIGHLINGENSIDEFYKLCNKISI